MKANVDEQLADCYTGEPLRGPKNQQGITILIRKKFASQYLVVGQFSYPSI
jgi:hypothetical protein